MVVEDFSSPSDVSPVVLITAIHLGLDPQKQPSTHTTVSLSPALLLPSPIRVQSHTATSLGF